jgi:hypothetical protein
VFSCKKSALDLSTDKTEVNPYAYLEKTHYGYTIRTHYTKGFYDTDYTFRRDSMVDSITIAKFKADTIFLKPWSFYVRGGINYIPSQDTLSYLFNPGGSYRNGYSTFILILSQKLILTEKCTYYGNSDCSYGYFRLNE